MGATSAPAIRTFPIGGESGGKTNQPLLRFHPVLKQRPAAETIPDVGWAAANGQPDSLLIGKGLL